MKIEEIIARFPEQWVALSDMEFCARCDGKLLSAEVAGCAADKAELLAGLPKEKHFFIIHTSKEGLEKAGLTD